MTTAPLGAVVRIYYDGRELAVGQFLRTPTGRHYEVIGILLQSRGRHVGRQHLVCRVSEQAWSGAVVVPLHWYKRGKRKP